MPRPTAIILILGRKGVELKGRFPLLELESIWKGLLHVTLAFGQVAPEEKLSYTHRVWLVNT